MSPKLRLAAPPRSDLAGAGLGRFDVAAPDDLGRGPVAHATRTARIVGNAAGDTARVVGPAPYGLGDDPHGGDPERIWDLVSDVTKIGRYSPETFEAEWLDGATGRRSAPRFRGHVKRNGKGPTYWTECTVTDCEPGRASPSRVPRAGCSTPGAELAPAGDGTDVTESFELSPTLGLRLLLGGAGVGEGTDEPERHADDAGADPGPRWSKRSTRLG